ncbi:DUF4278 domain-containing protein [Oscillatoria sp. CS-180]|uniref:arginine synthesis PII-interacting regulator PirA n=1 Tax=Oscillatoria sp. CS-180 TaxID=3021720 RepID=UPI00232E8E42|nr:DUF4278 domain-containing protein [Oscillatoria sp. CS-180]MDB9525763.1 DUF4278 domain-containing protein [Oscillatoria sp. CS-180]
MKLCYRGVEYDYTPPVLEVSESEVLGSYRGRPLRFAYVKHVPFPQSEANLTFRGANYHTNRHGEVEAVVQVKQAPQEPQFKPVFDSMAAARRTLLQESARAHQESMRRSLERRLQVAQTQGNAVLVRQLEAEMHQLA